MIDDAVPWKGELVDIAERLEARTRHTRWSNRTGFLIERDVAAAAYTLRKLIESHSVDDDVAQRQIPVRRFDLSGKKRPDPRFPDDIAEIYDFEHGRRSTLSVIELCHEILHSSVFAFFCGETADLFDGVFVSSNRDEDTHVYLVLASDFIALCSDAGAV